jgi:ethanolamine kinase
MGTTEASPFDSIRYLPLYYDNSDSQNSALNLILTLRPEWRESKDTIEFVKFTDGITNTVCRLAPSPFVHGTMTDSLADLR